MAKEFASPAKKTPKNKYVMAAVRKNAKPPVRTNANGDNGEIGAIAKLPRFALPERLKWTRLGKFVATVENNIAPGNVQAMVVPGEIGVPTARGKTKAYVK